MTIFREDCGYEPLTPERAPEFGVKPEEARYWFIEYEYGNTPLPGSTDRSAATEARLIPNTIARLANNKPILIGVAVKKK